MAEGEERLYAVVLVAAVAHEDTFLVDDGVAGRVGIMRVMYGVVFPTSLEGHRQSSGGVDFAKKNPRQGAAALLAGIPSVEDGRHAINPLGHVGAAAGRQHDDCLPVGRADSLDQFVLSEPQFE